MPGFFVIHIWYDFLNLRLWLLVTEPVETELLFIFSLIRHITPEENIIA